MKTIKEYIAERFISKPNEYIIIYPWSTAAYKLGEMYEEYKIQYPNEPFVLLLNSDELDSIKKFSEEDEDHTTLVVYEIPKSMTIDEFKEKWKKHDINLKYIHNNFNIIYSP